MPFSVQHTDPRYKWYVLAIACVGSMMGPLDGTIVSVSLPSIIHSLNAGFEAAIWIPTAYLLTISILLLPIGRLSDMMGRKRIYFWGFAIFVLGSFLCSLSPNADFLIAARVLQGAGAAFIMATSTALITCAFAPKERGKAIGINVMFVYVGLALGPPLGGFLTVALGWQSIFWVNIPIGICTMVAAYLVIEKDCVVEQVRRFDIKGSVAFAATLIALLLFLTFGEEWGYGSATILLLLLISVVAFIIFLRIEKAMGKDALLDLSLFRNNRLFAMGNLSALLNYTSYFWTPFIISFYAQSVLNYSPAETGLLLLVMPVIMACIAPISGILSDRIGSRTLATGGMLLICAGLLEMTLLKGTSSDSAVLMTGLIMMGVGMGMFSSPNTSAVMSSVPNQQAGLASGSISTMRTVGQTVSLSMAGALIAVMASTALVEAIFGGQIITPTPDQVQQLLSGFRLAFIVSAILSFIGAIASAVRPVHKGER
jgi:EmrB/QacA subfamily drug resistance transporter